MEQQEIIGFDCCFIYDRQKLQLLYVEMKEPCNAVLLAKGIDCPLDANARVVDFP